MASLRLGLTRIFKLLLVFSILPNAGVAAATSIPIATHTVIVKPGETYDGIPYPSGTIVHLTDIGNAVGNVLLSQDFKLNGHVIKKGTTLYIPNGKLSCYWSQQGQAIGLIVLKEEAQVCFEKNGALDQIHLRHANDILGNPFAANSWVQFHPSGKVAEGELARDVKRVGLGLAGGSKMTFHPSGSINSAAIKPGANFGKLRLAKHRHYESDVSFWPNGKLQNAVLAQAVHIGATSCAPGKIAFEESGALKDCEILKTRQQLAADAAQEKLAKMAEANLVRTTLKTPGVVSLIAGSLGNRIGTANASTDGVGAAARFDRPVALVVDSAGNLFLTESGANRRIRKISTRGVVTTIAGIAGDKGHGYQNGAAAAARFGDLAGTAIDKKGTLYVADTSNSAIRKISTTGSSAHLPATRRTLLMSLNRATVQIGNFQQLSLSTSQASCMFRTLTALGYTELTVPAPLRSISGTTVVSARMAASRMRGSHLSIVWRLTKRVICSSATRNCCARSAAQGRSAR